MGKRFKIFVFLKLQKNAQNDPYKGDFSHQLPNQRAIDATEQLIQHLKRQSFINPSCFEFYGHRDKGNTVCPGDPLYAKWSTWEGWHRKC